MKPRRRSWLAAAGAATAAAVIAAGCAPVDDDETNGSGAGDSEAADDRPEAVYGEAVDVSERDDGGRLVVGLAADLDILDPTFVESAYARYVLDSMCEKLYEVDAELNIFPQLAEDMPEISDDEQTLVIPLRQDATFSDGTELDADAVVTSLERHLNADGTVRTSEMGPVANVEATDDYEVTLTLDEPFSPLLPALADLGGMIMNPNTLDELDDDFTTDPSCVGAFRFVERTPGSSVLLEADPEYYDADSVTLEEIQYRIIEDAGIRTANLRSGDIHMTESLEPADAQDIREAEDIDLLEADSLGYAHVTFNVGNVDGPGQPPGDVDTPHAQDEKIRQAFEHAIDREAYVQTLFHGEHATACSAIAPDSPFTTDAAQECLEHDPERAQELLEEAGVETPYEITLSVSNTSLAQQQAQTLQGMVEEAGFAVEIDAVEFTTLLEQQNRGDFETVMLGWSGRADPDSNTTGFLRSGGSRNVAGYANPDVDALLDEARALLDTDERAEVYGQLVERVQEDTPIIYTHRPRNLTAVSTDIIGVESFHDGIPRVKFAGFAP